jgi:hypothetical protein
MKPHHTLPSRYIDVIFSMEFLHQGKCLLTPRTWSSTSLHTKVLVSASNELLMHSFPYIRKSESYAIGKLQATFYALSGFPLFKGIRLLDIWKASC